MPAGPPTPTSSGPAVSGQLRKPLGSGRADHVDVLGVARGERDGHRLVGGDGHREIVGVRVAVRRGTSRSRRHRRRRALRGQRRGSRRSSVPTAMMSTRSESLIFPPTALSASIGMDSDRSPPPGVSAATSTKSDSTSTPCAGMSRCAVRDPSSSSMVVTAPSASGLSSGRETSSNRSAVSGTPSSMRSLAAMTVTSGSWRSASTNRRKRNVRTPAMAVSTCPNDRRDVRPAAPAPDRSSARSPRRTRQTPVV